MKTPGIQTKNLNPGPHEGSHFNENHILGATEGDGDPLKPIKRCAQNGSWVFPLQQVSERLKIGCVHLPRLLLKDPFRC
jgi:hypothetical protein